MAKIPVATLTEHCWEKCPGFEVGIDRFYEYEDIFLQTCECKNLKICTHGQYEVKKEEKEWNKESAEEK